MKTETLNIQLLACDIKAISIIARKWFDKINGNTYHRVLIDIAYKYGQSETLDSGMHYGYGEQWDQTALELFCKHFNETVPTYPESHVKITSYLTRYCQIKNITCFHSVTDVSRKKDL